MGTLLVKPHPEDVATAQRGTIDLELLQGLSALHGARGQCEAGPWGDRKMDAFYKGKSY